MIHCSQILLLGMKQFQKIFTIKSAIPSMIFSSLKSLYKYKSWYVIAWCQRDHKTGYALDELTLFDDFHLLNLVHVYLPRKNTISQKQSWYFDLMTFVLKSWRAEILYYFIPFVVSVGRQSGSRVSGSDAHRACTSTHNSETIHKCQRHFNIINTDHIPVNEASLL